MEFLFCLQIKNTRTRTTITVAGTTIKIAKVAALFDLFPGGDGTIIGLLHIFPSELKLKSNKTVSSWYSLVQKEKTVFNNDHQLKIHRKNELHSVTWKHYGETLTPIRPQTWKWMTLCYFYVESQGLVRSVGCMTNSCGFTEFKISVICLALFKYSNIIP